MKNDTAASTLAPNVRVLLGDRAGAPLSAIPRPFLRWAGSKQRLLRDLVPLLPTEFNRYFEPFLGGGALFFLIEPREAWLSDASAELIATYRAVKLQTEAVLAYLTDLNPLNKDQYYRVRSNRSAEAAERAAEFIYLNRAGWNGLYRVNSRGEFNVPYGSPKSANLVDRDNLRACGVALRRRGIRLGSGDFADALRNVASGDFVFLDPPYVTGHENNGFIDYNERLFSWDDQVRLAKTATTLASRGAKVMVANASHDAVTSLYASFNATVVTRPSTLAGDLRARRLVREVVLRSYE